MDANLALERFIYLGTLLPCYVRNREPVKISYFDRIDALIDKLDANEYSEILKKCVADDTNIPRKDELWFTCATYLTSKTIDDKKRTIIKNVIPKYIKSSEELFLLAKYARDIMKEQKRSGLPKSIKFVVRTWYSSKSETDLMEMMSINRGLNNFTHKDLIKLCHVKLNTKKDFQNCALKKSKILTKNADEKTKEENENQDQNASSSSSISSTVNNFLEINKAKSPDNQCLTLELIKSNKIKFEQVHTKFLNRVDIWQALLPTLSYRTILNRIHFLIEKKMLNHIPFNKEFFAKLNNRDLIRQEKLHPISFLIERKKQDKQLCYSEKIKQSYHLKKIRKFNVKPNPVVSSKLAKLFELSFDYLQPIGKRMFIVINLQERYANMTTCSYKQIMCMEAAITLAFSYYKAEKNVTVFTFSSNHTKLVQIPWSSDFNYRKAEQACDKLVEKKNFQRNYLPINEAMKMSEVYDLFLIIVPSAARGNPNMKSNRTITMLETYRNEKNPNARMIIVNLARFKPAMLHEPMRNDGIFEICGFDENTPKLINSFALHKFS